MNTHEKVPTREKASYAMATFGINAVAGVVSSFVLYFFTDVALLDTAAVTGLLFAVRLFDGAIDPFIGHYMDSHRTRYGKYKGYLIYLSLPFSVLSLLLFLPSPLGSGVGGVVWYALIYVVWSFLFSMLECANLPLLVVMTDDPKQRYSVNSAKILGGIFATLVARYVVLELVSYFGDGSEAIGYAITMALLAVISFFFIQFPVRSITERSGKPADPPHIFKMMLSLLRDKKIVLMLLFFFSHQIASSMKNQAATYYMKYIVERQDLTSLFLLVGVLSSLAMQPVIWLAAKKVPMKTMIVLGYCGAALSIWVMGSAGTSVGMLFVGHILYGVLVAFPSNLLYVYVAELADTRLSNSGATLNSMLGLVSRFAVALAGSVISGILSISDYVPNVIQSADSELGIKVIFVVATSVSFFAAAVFAAVSFRIKPRERIGVNHAQEGRNDKRKDHQRRD